VWASAGVLVSYQILTEIVMILEIIVSVVAKNERIGPFFSNNN
jgi:hypothetical protein